LNPFRNDDVPDVAGHLFGRDRIALTAVRGPLNDAFGARCFYCDTALRRANPIDHVPPWSLVGIDGLANLVPACQRCNSDKRHSLFAPSISTGSSTETETCSETSVQPFSGPPSTTA
jgi:5-methylcytosine-specific restriction endonuclease McrA